jgi:hypothetical protein
MRTGLPPIVWWAEGYCPSSLFTSGSLLGETEDRTEFWNRQFHGYQRNSIARNNEGHNFLEKSEVHTMIVTPWSRIFIEKLMVAQLVKRFSVFYKTRNFSTVVVRALHWTILSQLNPLHTFTTYLFKICFRCSSRSSVSKEHLMGQSVYLSVAFFATVGPEVPLLEPTVAEMGLRFTLVQDDLRSLLEDSVAQQ